jgi:DNA-binding response OmpR family regulator
MKPPCILIVEDDEHLQDLYAETLEGAGFQVQATGSGREAVRLAKALPVDLLLLDLGLAGNMDGFEVLLAVRQTQVTPVMILTGQTSEAKLLRGLNLGADNYVLKPISKAALVARVRAHLRHTPASATLTPPAPLVCGPLTINLEHNALTHADGRRFSLRGVEKRILVRLLATPNAVVPYEELMRLGWPQAGPRVRWDDARALQSCVYRLRKKLSAGASAAIETVPDKGFVFRLAVEGENK